MAGEVRAEKVNLISETTTNPKMLYVESGNPVPNQSTTGDGYIKKIAISDLVYTRNEVNIELGKKADKVNITGATKTKITYNSQGIVTAGAGLAADDIPSGIAISKIDGLRTELDNRADKSNTYTKTETYTKDEVDAKINDSSGFPSRPAYDPPEDIDHLIGNLTGNNSVYKYSYYLTTAPE